MYSFGITYGLRWDLNHVCDAIELIILRSRPEERVAVCVVKPEMRMTYQMKIYAPVELCCVCVICEKHSHCIMV